MNYSYFVGLDVGKKSFDACLMSLEEKELSHRNLANTESGIHSLIAGANSHVPPGCGILFCTENMGSYVTALCVCS